MDLNTVTYTEMYNGRLRLHDPDSPGLPPFEDENPTYYSGDIGFEIRVTHKLAQDMPTITVIIPNEILFKDLYGKGKRGEQAMKRLKYYLQHMEESTVTYKEMYEGEIIMNFPPSPEGHVMEPEKWHDTTFWYQDMSVEIAQSNKLDKDKPTLTWHIPADRIGLKGCGEEGADRGFGDALKEAAADFCLREFGRYIDDLNKALYNRSRPDNENGKYYLCSCGGEVLARNAAYFAVHAQKDYANGSGIQAYLLNDGVSRPPRLCLCLKLQVQLPKRKMRRTVQMLCRDLPEAVERFVEEFDLEGLNRRLELAERQAGVRRWLKGSEYCAFIANGSILPRENGTNLPMAGAVPFVSAPDDEVEICGVRGMGIKKGVTVITGGGYSGKSTLLDAISAGIYNHVLGDGRELCITDETAVTIAAEDGRSVKCANISPFIKWIPGGDAKSFSTEHASGSTSQAANIVEAVSAGAGLLLIDEDRSATNFMIQDDVMRAMIAKEPITPFTERVRELFDSHGVSTILVIGGSSEYLRVADRVYMMEDYGIKDVTRDAKRLRQEGAGNGGCKEQGMPPMSAAPADWSQRRRLHSDGFTPYPEGSGSERLLVSDMGFLMIGDEKIDMRGLHDIVSSCQMDALGFMLRYLENKNNDQEILIRERAEELYEKIRGEGLDFLYSSYFTTCRRFLELPRKQELFALINRMRRIHFEAVKD